jgi:hypothetical protein
VLALTRAAAAFTVPGSDGRVTGGGYLDGLAVVDTGGGPRQRPQGLADLHLEAEPTRWLAGHAELRWRAGGPFEGGHPGHYDLGHEFQNYSPALEWSEAYLDVRLRQADFRAGVQKVAWGKLDGLPPTDVLNPRDYHDPLVGDLEERKIGVPMLLGTWYLADVPPLALTGVRLTALWVPLAVPSRLALVRERWFPSSTVPPSAVTVPVRLEPGQKPIPLRIPLVSFGTRSERPPRDVKDGGVGLRLGGTWREYDWDLYYYAGPEVGPDADLRATLSLASLTPLSVVARSELRQANDSIQMAGADWAMTLGGATVRAEAAYFDDRPYLRLSRDLISAEALGSLPTRRLAQRLLRGGRVTVPLGDLFPSLDAVEWGLGVDYFWRGFLPLLQVGQILILDPAPRLLIGDPETRLVASLRRRWLGERLEVELRGTYAVERGGWFVLPRVSYLVRDDVRLRLGYLAVGGPRTHVLGQFGRNDEVVFQARYTF